MTNEHTLDDLTIVGDDEVPPEDLHTDGDNPNEQGDATFGHLVDGLQSGWVGGPIVVNTGDLPGYEGDAEGLICDGEHRWRAAKEAGRDTVPIRRVDFDDDAQRRYWRQHLNKVTGEHDSKRDALEYDALLSEGYTDEVEALTEAADEDLDELLAELRVDNGVGPQYEYDPEHTVYFEDCVEGMRERLDDDSVDCVITDPPYGIDFQSGHRYESPTFDRIDADGDVRAAVDLFREVCREVSRVLAGDGHFYAFTRWDVYPHFHAVVADVFDDVKNCLVWRKNNWGMGDLSKQYGPAHEFIIYATNGNPRPLRGDRPADVLEYGQPHTEEYSHPTEKPVPLITDLLTNSTAPGDTVLDPFMGSGTTAVAAIQNDRDYVGFEIDEDNYRDVIERRIGEAKRQREASVNQEAEADD